MLKAYPATFSSKEIMYQKICGMARGYQKRTPNAFLRVANILTNIRNCHVSSCTLISRATWLVLALPVK